MLKNNISIFVKWLIMKIIAPIYAFGAQQISPKNQGSEKERKEKKGRKRASGTSDSTRRKPDRVICLKPDPLLYLGIYLGPISSCPCTIPKWRFI